MIHEQSANWFAQPLCKMVHTIDVFNAAQLCSTFPFYSCAFELRWPPGLLESGLSPFRTAGRALHCVALYRCLPAARMSRRASHAVTVYSRRCLLSCGRTAGCSARLEEDSELQPATAPCKACSVPHNVKHDVSVFIAPAPWQLLVACASLAGRSNRASRRDIPHTQAII